MKAVIRIGGMTCASCSASAERSLNDTAGVIKASVNLVKNTASVEYDPDITDISKICKAIENTGFDAFLETDNVTDDAEKDAKHRLIVAAAFTIPLLYVAMGHMIGAPVPTMLHDPKIMSVVQMILCVPAVIAGSGFYLRGFPNLIRLRPNMDSLIALGTSAALIFSAYSVISIFSGDDVHSLYFESAAAIIALVMAGKYLESRSKQRTNVSVRKLMDLAPADACVIRNGEETTVPIDDIVVGDIIVIRPGERIPADGTILSGTTAADESMLTGESVFAERKEGDMLYAGTMNVDGSIRMTVISVGDDTVLSQMIGMVEEAQISKAPAARLADEIAGYFVPAVMVIAAAACIIWLIAGKDIEFSLTVMISVLVIACPCALGLATPLAVVVGTGKGAEYGILFKTAEALELSGRADTVILDKTGTITEGRPGVTDVIAIDDEMYLLHIAASAESASEHPVGREIVAYSRSEGITISEPSNFKAHIGSGIECTVDGSGVLVGNAAFVERLGVNMDELRDRSDALTSEGKTVVFVSVDGKLAGLIASADTIRRTSASAVLSLSDMCIRTMMATGDGKRTAETIAAKAGIREVKADVRPDGKSAIVAKLRDSGHVVAMIGDGINDAPALTASDIGIAMSGTDIAIESADAVIMNGDLRSVPAAIEIGRAALKSIKQNLLFAFLYNIIGIPIAAGLLYAFGGPLLDPMIAAAAMSASSVSVVLNTLRMRSFVPRSLSVA